MSARAFVEQRAQYGKEAVAGVAVPADKRPSSGTLTLGPKVDTGRIRPSGEYFDSLVYQKTQDSEGSFEGIPSWDELGDYLGLIYGAPTTTLVDGTTSVYEHVFTLGATRPTWTVEYGDSTAAHRATGVFAKGCEIAFDANGGDATLNIDLLGGAIADGVTMTPGVAASTARPALAGQVKVYLADSLAALDTATPLAGGLKQTVKIDNIADLVRYFGSTGTVNTAPDATIELVSVADEMGRGFLADLATSRTRYIRLEATGAVIDGETASETLRIDTAVQVENHSRGEESAVYAATNTFRFVTDATGFSHKVTLTNGSNI